MTGVILTSSTRCCVILYDLLTLVHYCLIVTGSFIYYKNKHIRLQVLCRSYLQETLAKMSHSPQHHSFLFVLAVNRVRAHRRTRVRPARSKYVGKKVEDIMKTMDKTLMGSFVHHQGGKKEFQVFAKQEGIPFFVWYLDFKACRAKYRAAMETKIQALLTGAAPTKELISKKDLALAMKVGETAPGQYAWKIQPTAAA